MSAEKLRKVALITGGGTGVGAATARRLAALGYDLLVNYSKSAAEAGETAAACRDLGGGDAVAMQGDVAEDADCRALVAAAVERWGRVDVLVNNAGVTTFVGGGSWDALDAAAFDRIHRVNVVGTFQMVRAALPQLKANAGAVVNVSSIAGALGIGSSAAYIASKGAVNSLTLHMARTLAADGIRVNAVCPGLITTRWFVDGVGQEGFERVKANYERSAPLGRPCSADDVAEAVVWLADGARTVTGELLLLDAGMHLGGRMPVGAAAR